jgi:flavin-dependent dehydrogenase
MNPMEITQYCDALVIGAGPAGSAAAAVLAEAGLHVVVLEKEKFPRYHIGESLIPFTYHPLRRLGLIERMRASAFVKKYSVQFVSPSGNASQPFYFSTRYDADISQTWQVLRAEFDLMLLDNAVARGATVIQETSVKELLRENDRTVGVRTVNRSGALTEWRAPVTVDCSGREALAATAQNWRVRDPQLNKVAVWTYYRGAKRDPGIDAGATTVAFVPEKGWFWYIPQHRDQVSVGVVAEGRYLTRGGIKDPALIFQREVGQNLWIKEHLAEGQSVGDYFLASEYSYRSRYGAADGLVMAGDAFGFLDPVFSSGLLFALKSGVLAAETIVAGWPAKDFSASLFSRYGETMSEAIENMRKLVYAFYDPRFSFRAVTDRWPELAGDITDCLSGDVNKDFSRLFSAIAEYADVPEPLPCGKPLPQETLRISVA